LGEGADTPEALNSGGGDVEDGPEGEPAGDKLEALGEGGDGTPGRGDVAVGPDV
jgi:hypothetical protein